MYTVNVLFFSYKASDSKSQISAQGSGPALGSLDRPASRDVNTGE